MTKLLVSKYLGKFWVNLVDISDNKIDMNKEENEVLVKLQKESALRLCEMF